MYTIRAFQREDGSFAMWQLLNAKGGICSETTTSLQVTGWVEAFMELGVGLTTVVVPVGESRQGGVR